MTFGSKRSKAESIKPETAVVSVALGDMILRQIDLFDNVDEEVHHASHEHAEVVHVIDDVWILLDDKSQGFGTIPIASLSTTDRGFWRDPA
jgi:hypothetical protein